MLEPVELPAGLDGPVVRHFAGEVRQRPHRHAELVGRARTGTPSARNSAGQVIARYRARR
jgi:hypothetical protein